MRPPTCKPAPLPLLCRALMRLARFVGIAGLVVLTSGVGHAAPKVDRSPPTAPAIKGPRTTSSPRPVYRFVASDKRTPRSQLRYRCSFDSRRLRACSARYSRRLAVGRHVLRAQAVDRAGNRSRVRSVTVVVARRGQGPPPGQGSGLRRRHAWNIGRQWYVDALNGSDRTGNGSAGSPWQSLQRAADYLRTRATWPRGQDVAVNIRPTAAYKAPATEQATLLTDFSSPVRAPASNRYLIWRVDPAYPGRARIVNPNGASGNKIGVILGSSRLNSYQVFSGLDLDGERVRKGSGPGSVLAFYLSGTAANSNTHVEILNTKIHGFRATLGSVNTAQGVFADDGSSYLLFDRVEVYDIGVADDPVKNRSHGLYLQSHHNQITNSIFRDNPNGYGIQFYNNATAASPRSVVANCTFNNNYSSGILVHGDEVDVAFKNLIITDHNDRPGNNSFGIEFFPHRAAALPAASSTGLSTTAIPITARANPPAGGSHRADRRPPLCERRRRRPAPARRVACAWLLGYGVQPGGRLRPNSTRCRRRGCRRLSREPEARRPVLPVRSVFRLARAQARAKAKGTQSVHL